MSKEGYSRKGFFDQAKHYDSRGNQTGESRPSFWGGSHYYGSDSAWDRSEIRDEYEDIENEMMDEAIDPEEAAEWLEDNGYDPDDFDL